MQKLELTWIGKGQEPAVEPRILLHDASKDYGNPDTDNMLIHGDNLLALKALEQEFAGQVKCIYIDPPYNIKVANPNYDDGLEHSQWLCLIRSRLEILRNLLADDGVILVQIDKSESAYLKVLMDEVFGRNSFITTIAVRMSGTSGFKIEHSDKTIVKNAEHIHVYSRDLNIVPAYEKAEYDSHYSNILHEDEFGRLVVHPLIKEPLVKEELGVYKLPDSANQLQKLYILSTRFQQFVSDNRERIGRTHTAPANALSAESEIIAKLPTEKHVVEFFSNSGEKYIIKRTKNSLNQYIPISLKFQKVDTYYGYTEELSNILGDWWGDFYLDMGNVENEGGVEFKESKKPERLIFRILNMCTITGDIVLDSFLGSGTTAAVAHKMGRRYIGIELGDHCYTHCLPRLKAVVDGEQGGISRAVNWQGGGGFKFYELAPTLIVADAHGQPVISDKYNPQMLVAAVAKLNGFAYAPDAQVFWKQGKSQENSFIYVTTQYLTAAQLDDIARDLPEYDRLLICAPAFDVGLGKRYDNIDVRKIPKSVLDKCEYGIDNYNLNIINPPELNEEEWDDVEQ